MTADIDDLDVLVAALDPGDRRVFERVFRIDVVEGELVPPASMRPWIEAQFGAVEPTLRQRIVRVTNLATLDGALFSALRSLRPQPKVEPVDLDADLAGPDPLADPEAMTPADTFGRVRGERCVTAANIAKFDGLHSIVVFDEPHPLRFDRAQLRDYLATARRWFERAHEAHPEAAYPLLLWNCLWRAGASLAHGHLQVLLGAGMHYPESERLRRDARVYGERHGASYFDDLYRAHACVGAAFTVGPVRVLASLTPMKEREIVLLAERWDERLDDCLYDALAHLRDGLGVTSFNVALAAPPLDEARPSAWGGFPVIARIVDRGDARSRTADFGAMELYGAKVVSADPLRLAATLRQRMEARL